ncbi:response regulator [Ghiorsea bivora]|uniref:response regulator n=1 Tax=Ghiorsea bivora TaxID=1485545 RepID=UPI00068DE06A|nr:response regulator [Ghiorsea bivora]
MQIKQKLMIILLCMALLPMLFISTVFFHEAESLLKSNRIAALESIADLKVRAIERFMQDLQRDAAIAQDYYNIKTNLPLLIRFAHDQQNPAYIRAKKSLDGQLETLQKIKGFKDIMLLSPDGKVVYVSNQAHAAIDMGKPLVDRHAFEEGKHRIYLSDIIEVRKAFKHGDDIGGGYEMLATAPLFGEDGTFIGVLALETDMQPVYDLVQQTTGLGHSGETLIAQEKHGYALFLNVLRHDPSAAMHRRVAFGQSRGFPIQEAVRGHEGSGVSVDYRGEAVIAVWRYIPSMRWGMVSKIDVSEAFAPVVSLRHLALLVGGVVLVLIVLVAMAAARSFSAPIQELRRGIAIIGQGNLDHKVSTDRDDEIGLLSRAFDEMVVNLKTLTASRADFEKEIAERKRMEASMTAKNHEIAIRNRYEASYGKIVSLYAKSLEQEDVLNGTLEVLSQQHPFPVSAVYLYDEWSGKLTRAADHGIPGSLPDSFQMGEGVLGQAFRDRELTVLDELEGAHIISIDTGLLSFSPAAVIVAPICFQERALAVLVLASTKPLLEIDRVFIERLCRQMGVALNNITQHQALTNLAEELKMHSDEIKVKNTQLEQANRMKSEFLANMSHELRTPLNAIIGFSELLKDGLGGELQADQKDFVTDIYTSGKHLLSLINDILDLSKIEAGKMELDLEPVHLSEVLQNSVSMIKEKMLEHHLRLDCDFADNLSECYLDARKTKQMIYNMLSNAVKFTPDGGRVKFTVRRVMADALHVADENHPSAVNAPASPAAEFLEIMVSDTGIGISPEDQQQLFTPFQQLESMLTKAYEGTGLGLVILKRLAELHGGTVGLKSATDEGSIFVVWLPYLVSKQEAERQTSTLRLQENQHGVKKLISNHHNVLIVEDDEKAAALMKIQLERAGYATRHAISAEQALEMIADERPDLITLDIMLPGMDGWDLMHMLKQQSDTAQIPIVVVSIVADSGKGFSLGAADVLQKPVERQTLIGAIAGLDFSLEGKRVLVVDDDPKAVELVAKHLSTVGCDVLKAYGGKEAIDIAESACPDLIILDLMMPKFSGFDVVDKLKKMPKMALIPIIILTAKELDEKDRRQLNGDIIKVMQKSSFNHNNFINEVKRATYHSKQLAAS